MFVRDIQKGRLEILRLEEVEYRGHKLLDVRSWLMGARGELHRTKKGVCLRLDLIPEVIDALIEFQTGIESLEARQS